MKQTILFISIRLKSYGHWTITITTNKAAYSTVTTNSRAIDGYDGFERTLGKECIEANGLSLKSFTGWKNLQNKIE